MSKEQENRHLKIQLRRRQSDINELQSRNDKQADEIIRLRHLAEENNILYGKVERLGDRNKELKEDNSFLNRQAKNTDARLERLIRKITKTQAEEIKSLQSQLDEATEKFDKGFAEYEELLKYNGELQSQLTAYRWIPVERLSKQEEEDYLVYAKEPRFKHTTWHVWIAQWRNISGERWGWYGNLIETITHYMPIPILPEQALTEPENEPCKICGNTGLYQEEQDGGVSTLFCDCPIGQYKQAEFEDLNPDCKSLLESESEE